MSLLVLPLPLALAAAQPAAETPVAEPAVENEIMVIGRKLREFQVNFKLSQGKVACTPVNSLGDAALDTFACESMAQCVTTLFDERFAAVNWSEIRKKKRAAKVKEIFLQSVNDPITGECSREIAGPRVKAFLDAESRKRQ